ncbi:MAG: universal stress protein [Cyanobacteria bacterium J06555_13]
MMFTKILVALDPVDPDINLFNRALTMAQAGQANLCILTVLTADGDGVFLLNNPEVVGHTHALHDWNLFQERYRDYQESALTMLRSFTKKATAAGVRASFIQGSGSPGHEICRVAQAEQADLVMVGSRRYHGLDEMLLGSVNNQH